MSFSCKYEVMYEGKTRIYTKAIAITHTFIHCHYKVCKSKNL